MKRIVLGALLALTAYPALADPVCSVTKQGKITVTAAWSRPTIGTRGSGVLFLSIRNGGVADDSLVGISTSVAARPMLHQTIVTNGVSKMPHANSIPVPAGGTVELKPGSFHGMLMGLTEALKEGGTFPVTLSFENAGELTTTVDVLSMRAKHAACPKSE